MQSAWSRKWYLYLFAAGVALGGTALKIYQWYFSRPLWLDEEMVLLNVRDRALSDLIGPLWMEQAAPLGWLVLQRVVVTTFGTSDRAVRALPVLLGIGTLWVAFWMARRWMTPLAATAFLILCGIGQWITFYSLEVKPYSADGFSALALPALAIWAAEPTREGRSNSYRSAVWWIAAAMLQWVSFGAVFVTAGCACVLCASAWRRGGWRSAATAAGQGLIWVLCFGAHYGLSTRYAHSNEFFRNYWWWGLPPEGAGIAVALQWLVKQAQPLAGHPGGTNLWLGFWLTALYGFAVLIVRQPVMGFVLLSVPASAFLLAGFRLVPLADRLAFWMTPALYAGIAVTLDDVFRRERVWRSRLDKAAIVLSVIFAVVAFLVCRDIYVHGRETLIISGGNHGLDDRRGIRLLMLQRQVGDIFLTTPFGLPALWWYADINVADPGRGSRFPLDGAPIFELRHVAFGTGGCRQNRQFNRLSRALAGARRAAVYLGFHSNVPSGFQEQVLVELGALGTRIFFRQLDSESIAAIYDLQAANASMPTMSITPPTDNQINGVGRAKGCIDVQPAKRW